MNPTRISSPHLPSLRLAQLAEGSVAAASPHDVKHLASCARCMSTYAEYVTVNGLYLTDPSVRSPAPGLLELGRRAADRPAKTALTRPLNRRRAMVVAVALTAAAALALVAPRLSEPRVSSEVQRRLSDRMRDDSEGSLLYSVDLVPRHRGTRGGAEPLPVELSALAQAFAEHPRSAEIAYWLVAGSLATSQIKDAETYLGDARRRFPDDARFSNLTAILCYKKNDVPGAEHALREALRLERSPSALFNLSVVLYGRGATDEARQLQMELRRQFPQVHLQPGDAERPLPDPAP